MNLFLNNLAEIKISYSAKVPAKDRPTISCSRDAEKLLRLIYTDIEYRESFYILLLNRANRVLGFKKISEGGITGTVTDVRMVLQAALKANACAFICCHNHPSGNLKPSEADLRITKKIKEAGSIMDIAVLDHLILSEDLYFSFADENLM